jgi:hypothetical protein
VRNLFVDNVTWSGLRKFEIRSCVDKKRNDQDVNEIYLGGCGLRKFKIRSCAGKKRNDQDVNEIYLGGCNESIQVVDILESAAKHSNVLFFPFLKRNKLVDFAYSVDGNTLNCIHCTISKTHDAQPCLIFDLVTTCMTLQKDKLALLKIQLFYCVPKMEFPGFDLNPVAASDEARALCGKNIGYSSEIFINWHDIVSINILCVNPPNNPSSVL